MAPDAPAPAGPYSHAVRSGGLLFCSGQVPIDPATGKLVEGAIGDQAQQCIDPLTRVCRQSGPASASAA